MHIIYYVSYYYDLVVGTPNYSLGFINLTFKNTLKTYRGDGCFVYCIMYRYIIVLFLCLIKLKSAVHIIDGMHEKLDESGDGSADKY